MACKDIITIPSNYVYAPNVPEIYRFIHPEVYYDNCVNVEGILNDNEDDAYDEYNESDDDNIIDFKKFGESDYDFEDDDDEDDDEKEYKEKKKKKHHKKSKNKKHHNRNKEKDIYYDKEISDEERSNIKADLIRLIAERNMIKRKLGNIDPGTKKGANKIAEMNIALNQINEDIERLSNMIGEPVPELDNGSRSDRFFGRAKQKVQGCWKKFKKFIKRNKEAIIGISIMAIPVIAGVVARIILKV